MPRFDRSLPAPFVVCLLTVLGLSCAGGSSGSSGGSGGGSAETGGAKGSGGALAAGGNTGSGGALASGGNTGTGGVKAGTGGTTGSGGAPAAGGSGSSACTGCKLLIAAECQSNSDTQTVRVVVDVEDAAISALPLADVTFRYWFVTGTPGDTPTLAIDYAQIGSAAITSTFVAVSPALTGANEYLQVGFTPSTAPLTLFADTGQIQLRFYGTNNNSSFDPNPSSDYSYRPCGADASTSFTSAPTITGYINGQLAWGTEPQ